MLGRRRFYSRFLHLQQGLVQRLTAAWDKESQVGNEADGTAASEMGNLFQHSDTTKGLKLQQTLAEWNDEEAKISSALELLQ